MSEPSSNSPSPSVRPAQPADAEAIRAMYNREVLTSTATMDIQPRSVDEQATWMSERSGAHVVLVAVSADRSIVGFGSLSPWRNRPAYNTTVEDSVYVAPDAQAGGIGRLLLAALIETARAHGFHAVMARVVAGHEASARLHSSLGFELVGREREVGRKFGRWHDVLLMERLL